MGYLADIYVIQKSRSKTKGIDFLNHFLRRIAAETIYYLKHFNLIGIPKIPIRNILGSIGYYRGVLCGQKRIREKNPNIQFRDYQ